MGHHRLFTNRWSPSPATLSPAASSIALNATIPYSGMILPAAVLQAAACAVPPTGT